MSRIAATVYFGLIAIGLSMAVLTSGALAWDGSYMFFLTLDKQEPFIPHAQRFILLVGQGPMLLSSQWIDDITLLRIIFGLSYALITFGVLLLCWLIVKDRAPWLFLWPTLGIGIATLPRQITLYSEATIAMQLFWPLLLALLAGPGKRWQVLIPGLALVLLVAHPSAIPLIAFAAGVAFLLAFRFRDRRTFYLRQAGLLASIDVIALVIFEARKSSYESDHMSVEVLVSSFKSAVFGPMLLALLFAYLAVAILFAAPAIRQKWIFPAWADRTRTLYRVAFLAVAGAGVVLLVRVLVPRLWWTALDYRFWIVPITLPLLSLAVFEAAAPRAWTESLRLENAVRTRIVLLIAVIFAAALSANSLGWFRLTHKLENTLAASREACIPLSSIDWIDHTPLEHWSVATYSLVVQGRHPTAIVLPDDDCSAAQVDGLHVTDWYTRPWDKGWFDLDALDQRLARAP
jgi:hypothetical protein